MRRTRHSRDLPTVDLVCADACLRDLLSERI
jgi:hypothetical protein